MKLFHFLQKRIDKKKNLSLRKKIELKKSQKINRDFFELQLKERSHSERKKSIKQILKRN